MVDARPRARVLPSVPPALVLDAAARGACTVVDLRSPAEFAEDHLPGAHSAPLFDDVERAVIGTLYAKESPQAAFEEARGWTERGVDRLLARIASLVGRGVPQVDLAARVRALTEGGIEDMERGLATSPLAAEEARAWRPDAPGLVLHCWRGGLRSRSVAALLQELGFARVVVLEGGYKAYRRHVRERIAAWPDPAPGPATFVLRGLTGVGKTLVLRAVEALRPDWTLDLEGLAGHRSSILGMVGLEPCTQKTFDTRLCARLERGFSGPCVVEGESRKVGDVVLPSCVWQALQGGTAIEIHAPPERRVDVLIEDYLAREENRAQLAGQLPFLEERLGKRGEGLSELLATGRERELVARLLRDYYDPLYRHSEARHPYAHRVDGSDPARAAAEVVAWIEARA